MQFWQQQHSSVVEVSNTIYIELHPSYQVILVLATRSRE